MKIRKIKYCCLCSSTNIVYDNFKKIKCNDCGWIYYHNVAASSAAIIINNGKLLILIRNQEPKKGFWDVPGGFIDPKETANEAICREIKEEIGVNVKKAKMITTYPNVYEYGRIDYNICDIIFTVELDSYDFKIDNCEICAYEWIDIKNIDLTKFAFDSIRNAVKDLVLR